MKTSRVIWAFGSMATMLRSGRRQARAREPDDIERCGELWKV